MAGRLLKREVGNERQEGGAKQIDVRSPTGVIRMWRASVPVYPHSQPDRYARWSGYVKRRQIDSQCKV